nr:MULTISPECIES: restriction endonuclease subunit S [unclassified Acinetobacter]
MAAPKLRFKEFDGDWVKTNFGKVASHISYGLTVRPEYIENGIKLISAREISTGNIDFDNAPKISISDFMLLSDKAKPQKYDLFLSKTGSIGFTSIVETDEKFAITQNIANIRLNNLSEQDPYFFLQQMRTTSFQLKAISVVNQSTIMDLQLGDIKKLEIGYPSKEEQTKIASFLSSVDEKINQLTQKHELLSQYKQGMMQKLFSQQIRFKADDGSEFGEWKTKKLEDIFSFSRGEPFSKTDISENGEFLCIHYGELFTKYKEVITNISSKTSLLAKNLGEIGDILMPSSDVTPDGLAKASCLNVSNVFLGGDINILRPQIPCSSEFFSYLINFEKQKVLLCVTGTTVKHVYNKDLKKIGYIYPCLEEQTKIANFLSAIDQKIEVVAQQIEQAKTWKKGLLQQMFV